jgi:hypothetical protein
MEIFQEYNFNSKEIKIWEIFEAYKKFCNKAGYFMKFLPTKTDPRESKNWKYFESVFERFKKDSVFDPYIFIEAQFRNLEKGKIIFPAQLKTNIAVEKYKEHRESLKIKEEGTTTITEKIMTNLANTFMFLKKWWSNKELIKHDYGSFFKKKDGEIISEGMYLCMQNMISKYFMSVSKHFLREYNKLDSDIKYEIIELKELENFRVRLKLNSYAYEFAKEIFKGEIL